MALIKRFLVAGGKIPGVRLIGIPAASCHLRIGKRIGLGHRQEKVDLRRGQDADIGG